MGRKNRNPRTQKTRSRTRSQTDRYDVDYVYLPDAQEIAAVAVPSMKTIYRNMCCAPWADEVHEARDEKDKYLAMIRRAI